ncbi:MAG TPA: phytanoyl-CoA dioxygenase family protein [Caulobacteraceae bacterium]|nr:phytanoyl-CoA dioxygenase family protein [Caulobacteraceae bacterium]
MSIDERAPAATARSPNRADVEPTLPGQIAPTYARVERFAPGSAESVAYLREHGYVVIAGALSPEQTAEALSLTWDYLEGLGTGIDRNDWTTWDDDRWPTAVHGGILPGHGIGHSAAQWFIRSAPAVKQTFAAVWDGDDDLLVSFDGMSLWRPWPLNEAWKTNRGGSWLHIDQHPITRPGRQCVQGLVNLLPMSPSTGGNVLIPGSHKTFEHIPEVYPQRLGRVPLEVDHFRFPADDPMLAGTPPIMCHMEAGDLLLWDSRTIHCSSGSLEPPEAKAELLRAIGLVCMMPRRLTPPEVLEQRRKAVERVTSTTNWTDRFINADRFPQILAEPRPERFRRPPSPQLDEYQRRLAGF